MGEVAKGLLYKDLPMSLRMSANVKASKPTLGDLPTRRASMPRLGLFKISLWSLHRLFPRRVHVPNNLGLAQW